MKVGINIKMMVVYDSKREERREKQEERREKEEERREKEEGRREKGEEDYRDNREKMKVEMIKKRGRIMVKYDSKTEE